ncbi:putative cysteine-rich motor neuron 1 protein-like [Triplophysa rosa]|uniref:Cysteine-rich motor neuron 1 protein-like n=1 Tax=Triplophysa rosa TaxID=992332 RepID=A0A9W7T247_TRIRA|nr:putative cysteine-rich motor neuron 1 protein-like [Triplophysa rosa]
MNLCVSITVIMWSVLAVMMTSLEITPPELQVLQALHCPPCERIHCSPRRSSACAKLEGESCGGTWDYLGKCDEGLVCVYQEGADGKAEERKGTCKPVLEVLKTNTCRPDCMWEYCQSNPNEICSARSVSMKKRECGGHCQHTTCSSCLLLIPPSCPQSCSPTDHVCLHRFGRCVRGHLTEEKHPPICHQNLQSKSEGFFVCLAPACPTTAN